MAVRPVYSAEIKFDFDTKGLEASVKKIENTVRSSIQNIGKMTSDIKIDIPSLEKIGKLGGLSNIGDRLAKQIRGQVGEAFKELGDDIDPSDIDRALREVADTFGSTSDSIVKRLARLTDATGMAFKEIKETGISESQALYTTLIDRSIFISLVDDTIMAFDRMSAKVIKTFKGMSSGIVSIASSATEKASDIISAPSARRKVAREREMFGPPSAEGPADDAQEAAEGVSNWMDRMEDSIVDAGETVKWVGRGVLQPFTETLKAVTGVINETTVGTKRLTNQFNNFGEIVEDARISSAGFGKSAFATGAVLVLGENVKNAAESIQGLKKSTIEFRTAAKEAFRFKKKPEETMGITGIRKSIALLEESMSRMPDKTSASFKALNRQFSEARTSAIKMQKSFEKGLIDEAQLAVATESLDDIGKSIKNLKTEELTRLREELNRNSEAVSLTRKNFSDRMQDIKDGISLASETGENKLLSLRLALFGVGEATGPVGKLLDRFTSNVDDVGKAEGRLAEITSRTTQSLSSQQAAIKGSIDVIKKIASAEGLHASALNDLDKQVNDVQNAYEAMTSTIQATGKATPAQVARVRDEYRLLEDSIRLVKEQNKDAIGPDTLKAFGALEKRIKSNIPATRVLAATLNTASEKVEKLKNSSDDLNEKTKRSVGIFGRLKSTLINLLGVTSKQVDGTRALGAEMDIAAGIASRVSGAFLGAFGGTLVLGAIDRVKNALTSMSESTGSQIEKETARIQKAFALIPSEAEAVSGAISDVYESNLGGSVEEVGEATQRAVARFKELGVTSQEEIASVTADAFRLSDTYKFDVPESLDAAAVLMKSFNLTTKESTEFLTGLGQAGIIGSDAIDSILEYSTQIQSAGGNADDLFNIIRTGFAGGGSLGTDKAVDLFKEFRLLISEGSDDVKDALNEIGINSTQLMSQLSDGTVSVTDAFDFVNEKLGQLDSQAKITTLGATLMGTQFEDMGNQMALAIRTTGTSMTDLSGITVGLATTYTDLGSGMEAINRRLQVSLGPLKDTFLALANQAIPFVMSGIDALAPVVERVAARVQLLISALSSRDWGTAKDIVVDAVASIAEGVSSVLEWLIVSGFDWGASFVIQIANGLIETANSVIIEAMNYIADMIASFMAPGSPPEKGPLSNIDKWGKGLVDTFGESFSSADFKFVEQATKPIEEHFKKTFGKGGFDAFKGVRDKFTEIVTEINKTGIIDETKFKEIEGAIGSANTELAKMLKTQLKLKSAEQALANIQEEATEAQAAGFVSEGLKKKLKAAEEEVSTAKENVEWQKEFLKFQGLSEDKFTGMGAAAAKGAMGATKAIKGAVDKQLLFINEGFEKEKRLLKEKFSAGIIGEDEYLKKLIKLEEKYVDYSQEKGLLSGAQLLKWGDRLSHLRSSLEQVQGMAEAAKKSITPIGEMIFGGDGVDIDAKDITGDIGKNLLTSAKDLGSSFSDNLADGLLETAKTRMASAFSEIGTKISELFKTKILDKLTPKQKATGGLIGSALLGIGVSATITKIGLVASKIGALSGFALRLSVIGTAIWLIWKNWDTILAGINTAIEYLTGLWADFTKELGGSEETLAIFSSIFTDVKETLISIGTGLKNFVLDALAGESIAFSDFIDIFDISGIDTAPITKVVEAFMSVLQSQVDRIKLSISFGDDEDGPARLGGEMEDADPTRFEKIAANFTSIFNNIKQSILDVQASFAEFMAEDRLGGKIAGLIDAITESWAALSIVIGGPLLMYLPSVLGFLGKFVPIIGPIASTLGKLIPIVGIATVLIGNFEKIWPPLETALGGAVLAVTGIVEAIGGIFLLFDDETRAEGVEMFFSGVTDVIGGLQDAFLGLGVAIANFFLSAVADISGGVASILEAFDLDEIAKPFRNVEEGLDGVAESLKTALDDALAILRGLRAQVKIILSSIARNFTNWVKGIWESVTGWFKKLWNDLVGNSIITDMVADIVKALGMEAAVKKVRFVVATIKLAFFNAKTYVSTQMSLLGVAINSKFSAMSTFVSGKITALKGFVTDVKTFISDTVTAIGGFKLPTLTEIATSTAGVVTSMTDLAGIDISAGVTSITDSLSTLATDGVASVKTFATDTLSAITGVDMSTGVDAMFAPFETALAAITEFDAVTVFSDMFEGVDISTVVSTIFSPIQTAIDSIAEFSLSEIFGDDAAEPIFSMEAIGIPTGEEVSTAMTDFTTGIATPIANLGVTINDSISATKTTISGIFADIDPTLEATAFAVGAATPISLLETTIGDSAAGMVESLLGMFDIDLSVSVSDMSTTVVTGIETMATDGIKAVSGFATDFVDYILSIPERIKERISDFTDIGSLLSSAFGFGKEDITGEIASDLKGGEAAIVAPVTSTTDKIKGAWDDAYDWVVGKSVVPDLVAGVTEQFTLMSVTTLPTVTSLTLAIQNSFTTMSTAITQSIAMMNLAIYTDVYNTNFLISNDYLLLTQTVSMHMVNMNTNTSMVLSAVRPLWLSGFTAMINITRAFGVVGKQILTAIDNAVRKLTISVGKLKDSLVEAKIALDDMKDTSMEDLIDSFDHMRELVKKTKKEAEKFAKFMEAAAKSAREVGDTLGGNTAGAPSAQHGAWRVPRNQMMFLHEGETILPSEVAANFRQLMIVLQEAGIGGRSFGFQTGTSQATGATAGGPTIVHMQNTFPNVKSAQEAEGIATELNRLIDDARKFASVGGSS